MRTVLIVVVILILIVMSTIHLSARLDYDLLENVGMIKIKLFNIIPIFVSRITVAGEYLNFNKRKGKVIKIKIDLNDYEIQFFNDVGNFLKKKITLLKLHTSFLVCFENPCVSTTIGSMLNVFVSILFAQILTYTTDVDLHKYVATGFRQLELKTTINTTILFSIYDFAWALLKAYKLKIRRRHEKENKLQQNW